MTSSSAERTVALVSMPFHVCALPPIGLGLLQSTLAGAGLPAKTYNFNLHYLQLVAPDPNEAAAMYDEICYFWDFLPGEWLFSPRVDLRRDARYLEAFRRTGRVPDSIVGLVARLRPLSAAFAEQCAATLLAAGHDLVGFTSSFMQTNAAVAVAKALKRQNERVRILFGGSNAFGEMGLAVLQQWPEIDVVAHGEAERLIVPLVRALRDDAADGLAQIRGISFRRGGAIVNQQSGELAANMSEQPLPEYGDYFATVGELRAATGRDVDLPKFLPIETARGCWWGEKSHCTFCGLNGDRMAFRSKPPATAAAEFRELYLRYRVPRFFAVDNIIDYRYFDTVLAELSQHQPPLFIHYEIKANLTRRQVGRLAAAGVRKVQPGIESLDTAVLRLMRKGITAIQNVQTLKWLTQEGLQVSWYLLYGFPGERLESYRRIHSLVPRLRHLAPPHDLAPVYLERFSPYHSSPAMFGIRNLGPASWYEWAFPDVPAETLARLAYRFDFDEPGRNPSIIPFVESAIGPEIRAWQDSFEANGCILSLVHGPEETAIVCGPFTHPERVVRAGARVRAALRISEGICSETAMREAVSRAEKALAQSGPADEAPSLTEEAYETFLADRAMFVVDQRAEPDTTFEELLATLESVGLVMREDGRVLGLAVDRTELVRSVQRETTFAGVSATGNGGALEHAAT